MALVLSRKMNESILIEDDIELTVVGLDPQAGAVSLMLSRLNGEELCGNEPIIINKDEKIIILQVLRVCPLTVGRVNVRLAFETLPGCEQLDVYRAELKR